MSVSVFWHLARDPRRTPEEFRDWFETSHVPLAMQHFGHLLLAYRRHYPTRVTRAGEPVAFVDCVAEWVLEDAATLDEILAILRRPDVAAAFAEDIRGNQRDSVQVRVDTVEHIAD